MKRRKLLLYILLAPAFVITILYLKTQSNRIDDQKKIKELELKIEKMEKENSKVKKQKAKSPKYTPENNALRELMRWEG